MKSRQQNYRMQNAKIQTRQDIYGMKKTKYRKLTTYQQKCRKRPGVEATHGRSITNSRKPDIHEKQIKNFEENEIKAKISNGIWKFRTKFWNDSIKIYIGHVVHSSFWPALDICAFIRKFIRNLYEIRRLFPFQILGFYFRKGFIYLFIHFSEFYRIFSRALTFPEV